MIRGMKQFILFILALFLAGCVVKPARPRYPTWDDPNLWRINRDAKSSGELSAEPGRAGSCLRLDYVLRSDYGWVTCKIAVTNNPPDNVPVFFSIQAEGDR